jgi:hypothetical protein
MLVRFQTEARDFSLPRNVQTGPGIHPAFCLVFTGPLITGVDWPGPAVPNPCGTDVISLFIHPLTYVPLCRVQGPHRRHADGGAVG